MTEKATADGFTQDVDLLYELGELRKIKRYFQYAQGSSSVAEHTLRVCFTAMILAIREKADVAKTIQIAMLHDVPEIRTGDANPWQKPYVELHTLRAASDMLGGTTLQPMLPLVEDYEERGSLESRIVKDADMIECEMEMRELKEMGSNCHAFFDANGDTEYVFGKLRTESGRAMFRAVCERRPFDRCLAAVSSFTTDKHGS